MNQHGRVGDPEVSNKQLFYSGLLDIKINDHFISSKVEKNNC